MTNRLLQAALATVLVFGSTPAFAARIVGTATYRERIALAPGAVFEAELQDVSLSDASARVVAHVRKAAGQVPISFVLRYDPRRIRSRHAYVVRGTIREGDRLRFSTDRAYSVLTHGHGSHVALVLQRTGETGVRAPAPGLANNRWRPVQIGNLMVSGSNGSREPWIEFDDHAMRITGSGGCNRVSGPYEAGEKRLQIGPLTATQMACVDMETERAFLQALRDTRRYKLFPRVLELLDDRELVLARLEERNLR